MHLYRRNYEWPEVETKWIHIVKERERGREKEGMPWLKDLREKGWLLFAHEEREENDAGRHDKTARRTLVG